MKRLLMLFGFSLMSLSLFADNDFRLKTTGYFCAQAGSGVGMGYSLGRIARAFQSQYPNSTLVLLGAGIQSGLIVPDGIDRAAASLQNDQRTQLKGRLAYYGGYFAGALYATHADLDGNLSGYDSD